MKTERITIRFTPEQAKYLRQRAKSAGYFKVVEFIRSILFSDMEECEPEFVSEFYAIRGERRSFYCSNELWEEMRRHVNGKCSLSKFIKQAIHEKIKN